MDTEGFTREESNVKTKLDRIYARDNELIAKWRGRRYGWITL